MNREDGFTALLRDAVRGDAAAMERAARLLVRRGQMELPQHRMIRKDAYVQRRVGARENLWASREDELALAAGPEDGPDEPVPEQQLSWTVPPRSVFHTLQWGEVVQNVTNHPIEVSIERIGALQRNDNARIRASVPPTPGGPRRSWPPPVDAREVAFVGSSGTAFTFPRVASPAVFPELPEPEPDSPLLAPLTDTLLDLTIYKSDEVMLYHNGLLLLYGADNDWWEGDEPERGEVRFAFATGPRHPGDQNDLISMVAVESGMDYAGSLVRGQVLAVVMQRWPEIIREAAEKTP